MKNDIKCLICDKWLYDHTTDDAMNCLVAMTKPDFNFEILDRPLSDEKKDVCIACLKDIKFGYNWCSIRCHNDYNELKNLSKEMKVKRIG